MTFLSISRAPLEKLQAYKRRTGQLLDQVPKGRGDEVRARRHDEYEDAGSGATG